MPLVLSICFAIFWRLRVFAFLVTNSLSKFQPILDGSRLIYRLVVFESSMESLNRVGSVSCFRCCLVHLKLQAPLN